MLTCGSNRNRSTPSNLVPFDEALAVISSIVSRSIGGSAPGPPLPTSPGHIALWIAGYLCWAIRLVVLGWSAFITARGAPPPRARAPALEELAILARAAGALVLSRSS